MRYTFVINVANKPLVLTNNAYCWAKFINECTSNNTPVPFKYRDSDNLVTIATIVAAKVVSEFEVLLTIEPNYRGVGLLDRPECWQGQLPKPESNCLVWWLNDDEYAFVKTHPKRLPVYITDLLEKRSSVTVAGELFTCDVAQADIFNWPTDNLIADWIAESGAGGIVILEEDSEYIANYPGTITDTKFRKIK